MLAAAGAAARIVIYEYDRVAGAGGGVVPGGGGGPSPATEMATRSKLTCLAYSAVERAHLIAGDYDGVVTLWDTSTQQSVSGLCVGALCVGADLCGGPVAQGGAAER
eukprot:296080-Chlamydomonas_euryale.AAC.1